MRAYDLYIQMKKRYDRPNERALAEKHGYVDDIQELYKELQQCGYQQSLREDFSDEEFKTFFYDVYNDEIADENVKMGNYILEVTFQPFIKQVLHLNIAYISNDRQISLIDKDMIYVSAKYFKTLDALNAFIIELKMIFSDRYDIRINK